MSKNNQERLGVLRQLMTQNGVDAYIVPRADEYLGEFVANYAQRLEYLTGFTGSAGVAIITQDLAIVMSDGRYTIQLRAELDAQLFTAEDSTKYPLKDWLYDNLQSGQVAGFDPRLHSAVDIVALQETLSTKQITCKALGANLIDALWDDQPDYPDGPVMLFDEVLAGKSRSDKITAVFDGLKEAGASACFITKPDSISWLLNIRGSDLDYMPVALSVILLDVQAQQLHWFIDAQKITSDVNHIVADDIVLHDLADVNAVMDGVSGGVYALDGVNTPYFYYDLIRKSGKSIIDVKDPCVDLKACKNAAEKQSIKQAHLIDGAAIVKVLHLLDEWNAQGQPRKITEMDVAAKLDECRKENPAYKGESFPAITGYAGNGAIVHYRATPKTNTDLTGDGLLLIDSGGQYYDQAQQCAGTTDITRTVLIGSADRISSDIKTHFTLVLKGHIDLALAHFYAGTTGMQIDALARQPLQNAGLDYAHGTGHGVGCFGDVHEEAASISPRGKAALQGGMLLSNEPGYYEEGSHGIRTESLVFVTQGGDKDLYFDTITLAPIDRRLIVKDLLDERELTWLNDYHARVYDMLSPLLDDDRRTWLRRATAAI